MRAHSPVHAHAQQSEIRSACMQTANCGLCKRRNVSRPEQTERSKDGSKFGVVYRILHLFLLLLEVTRTHHQFAKVPERRLLVPVHLLPRVLLLAQLAVFNHHRFTVNEWIYFGPTTAVDLRQHLRDQET